MAKVNWDGESVQSQNRKGKNLKKMRSWDIPKKKRDNPRHNNQNDDKDTDPNRY